MPTHPTPKKTATPWPRHMALAGAGVFVLLGAWPYFSSATRMLAAGDSPSAAKVKQEVEVKARREREAMHGREIKALAVLADGRVFLGNKGGLAVSDQGRVSVLENWPGGEVKQLVAAENVLWAVGKEGVWKLNGDTWHEAYDGEVQSLAIGPDRTIYLGTKGGVKFSRDGAKWDNADVEMPSNLVEKGGRDGQKERGGKERKEKGREEK